MVSMAMTVAEEVAGLLRLARAGVDFALMGSGALLLLLAASFRNVAFESLWALRRNAGAGVARMSVVASIATPRGSQNALSKEGSNPDSKHVSLMRRVVEPWPCLHLPHATSA